MKNSKKYIEVIRKNGKVLINFPHDKLVIENRAAAYVIANWAAANRDCGKYSDKIEYTHRNINEINNILKMLKGHVKGL